MTPIRHSILAVFLLVLAAGPAMSADPQAAGRKTAAPNPAREQIVTREAVCRWTATPPVLDGKLDDACWKDAVAIRQFGAYWDEKAPRSLMVAYLLWDNDALYYAGRMIDSELQSKGTQRNDTLWDGDVFELFFKPSTTKPQYYEFQANPQALVFECYFPRRGVYPKDIHLAPVLGSKAAVGLDGTLNRVGDTDKAWIVEGRIPWTAFRPTGGRPRTGDTWTFALCRYDHGPQGTKPVLSSSAPLTKPSFHQYEDYGTLRFEGPKR